MLVVRGCLVFRLRLEFSATLGVSDGPADRKCRRESRGLRNDVRVCN